MSPKLHQHGSSEAGSHDTVSEPSFCARTSSAHSCIFNPSAHRWRGALRFRDRWSSLPTHFATSRYEDKPWIHYLTEPLVTNAHTSTGPVHPAVSPERAHLVLQTVVACNPDCCRRVGHQKTAKTSNYIRPGPQLMQSDRAPRNPPRHDDAD